MMSDILLLCGSFNRLRIVRRDGIVNGKTCSAEASTPLTRDLFLSETAEKKQSAHKDSIRSESDGQLA